MIHIAPMTAVTYVTFIMFHYIGSLQYTGIPVPDLVGARGTLPANGEVPARERDAGAVNVEGGFRHSPRKGMRCPGPLNQLQREVPHLPDST